MMKSFYRKEGYNLDKTLKQLMGRWNTITREEVKTVLNKYKIQQKAIKGESLVQITDEFTTREEAIMKDILSWPADIQKHVGITYVVPHYDYGKKPDGSVISGEAEQVESKEYTPTGLTAITEYSISTKKATIKRRIPDGSFVDFVGYSIAIPQYPNADMYVGKLDKEGWFVIDNKSGFTIHGYHRDNGQMKISVDDSIHKINDVINNGKAEPVKVVEELLGLSPSTKRTEEQQPSATEPVKAVGEIKPQTKAARDNGLIDIMRSVLNDPNHLADIMTPGGFQNLIKIADIMKDKFPPKSKRKSIFDIMTIDEMAIRNLTGKALTPLAANHNSHHALRQHFNLGLSTPLLFDGVIFDSLSGKQAKTEVIPVFEDKRLVGFDIKNGDNVTRTISRNMSEFLAAIVDNAKDPIAAYINYTKDTVDIMSLLVGAGVDHHTAIFFLSQPIILKVLEMHSVNPNEPISASIGDIIRELGMIKEKKVPVMISTNDLYKAMNTSDIDTPLQRDVLMSFISYSKTAKDLGDLIRNTTADTKGLRGSLAAGEVIMEGIRKMLTKGDFSITGIDDMVNLTGKNDLIAAFTEYGVSAPLELLNQLYPYSSQEDENGIEENLLFTEIKRQIGDNLGFRDLSEDERNYINRRVVDYVLSGFNYFDISKRDDIVTNTPKRLGEMKDKYPQYSLFKGLRHVVATSKIPIDHIEFNTAGTLSDEQRNNIYNEWAEMLSSRDLELKEFANDLIKLAFFTTGLSFNVNGYGHLISPSAYIDYIRDDNGMSSSEYLYSAIKSFNHFEYADRFVEQFYRNEHDNPVHVPTVADDNSNVTTITPYMITIEPEGKAGESLVNVEYDGMEKIYTPKRFIAKKSFYRNEERSILAGKDVYDSAVSLYRGLDSGSRVTYIRVGKLGVPRIMNEYNIFGDFTDQSSYIKKNHYIAQKQTFITQQKPVVLNNAPTEKEVDEMIKRCNTPE